LKEGQARISIGLIKNSKIEVLSDPIEVVEGDLVTIPKGLVCIWKASVAMKKYYKYV